MDKLSTPWVTFALKHGDPCRSTPEHSRRSTWQNFSRWKAMSFKKLVCKRFLQANTWLVCEGVPYWRAKQFLGIRLSILMMSKSWLHYTPIVEQWCLRHLYIQAQSVEGLLIPDWYTGTFHFCSCIQQNVSCRCSKLGWCMLFIHAAFVVNTRWHGQGFFAWMDDSITLSQLEGLEKILEEKKAKILLCISVSSQCICEPNFKFINKVTLKILLVQQFQLELWEPDDNKPCE